VQTLLDAVIDYLPSPLDVPPATGLGAGTDNTVVVETSDAKSSVPWPSSSGPIRTPASWSSSASTPAN